MPGTATMDKASSTIEETSSAAMRVTVNQNHCWNRNCIFMVGLHFSHIAFLVLCILCTLRLLSYNFFYKTGNHKLSPVAPNRTVCLYFFIFFIVLYQWFRPCSWWLLALGAVRVTQRLTPHLGSHEQAARLNPADVVRQDNAGVIKRTKPEKQTVFCCLSCTSPCPVEPAALSDESLLPWPWDCRLSGSACNNPVGSLGARNHLAYWQP